MVTGDTDTALMRFTSRDPVRGSYEEPMTLHRYLYCLNDPLNRTDPSGKLGGLVDRIEEDLTDDIEAYYVALDEGLQASGGSWEGVLDVAATINAGREGVFSVKNFWKDPDEHYCGHLKGVLKSVCKIFIKGILSLDLAARYVCHGPMVDCIGKCGDKYYNDPGAVEVCGDTCAREFRKCAREGP